MIFAGVHKRIPGIVLIFGLLLAPVSMASALDLAAGGGISLNPVFVSSEFGGYSEFESDTGFGVRAFGDLKYLEVSVGLVLYDDRSYASGCALVKVPFRVRSWSIFPLAGGEYRYDLDVPNASVLLVKGGLGADIPLTGRMFLRPEILAGYMFRSRQEDERLEAYKAYGGASILKISVDISLYVGYRL